MREISAALNSQRSQIQALTAMVPSLDATLQRLQALGATIETVLDIGACEGNWTRSAKRTLPTARYTLVEPLQYDKLTDDDLADCIVHQALLYCHGEFWHWASSHVHVLCPLPSAAVCMPSALFRLPLPYTHSSLLVLPCHSEEAEVDWYELRNTGDSIYKERTLAYENVTPQRRMAVTLATLLGEDSAFDLIKLDVQGAELDVMRGGEAIMRRASFVLLEVPFMGQYNAGSPSFLEVIAYMDTLGFVPFDILELHHEVSVLLQCDIMFVRRDHAVASRAQRHIENFKVVDSQPQHHQPAAGDPVLS